MDGDPRDGQHRRRGALQRNVTESVSHQDVTKLILGSTQNCVRILISLDQESYAAFTRALAQALSPLCSLA